MLLLLLRAAVGSFSFAALRSQTDLGSEKSKAAAGIFLEPVDWKALGLKDSRETVDLTDAVDWLAFNASYPESVADPDFFDATNYIGAVNPDGSDIWWAGWTLSGTLPNPPALDVPASPTITSTDYEDGTIILTVSVSNNGGAKIRRYDAACSDGTDVFTGTSTSSPITVSGLTNGVAYTCTVTATNSVGTSSASAATAPIIPEEQVSGGLPIWLLYQATQ